MREIRRVGRERSAYAAANRAKGRAPSSSVEITIVAPTPSTEPPRVPSRRRSAGAFVALVAGVTVIFVSTYAARQSHEAPPVAANGTRDTSFVLATAPGHRAGTLELSWPRVDDAIEYRIDLTAADGQPLGVLGPFQDPSFTLASGGGAGLEAGREVIVRIVALGNDRIVRVSAPTRVTMP